MGSGSGPRIGGARGDKPHRSARSRNSVSHPDADTVKTRLLGAKMLKFIPKLVRTKGKEKALKEFLMEGGKDCCCFNKN